MTMILSACSGGTAPSENASAEAPTQTASFYQTDIAPMLQSSCATCHLTGQEAGNMALVPAKAIATLVGVKSSVAPSLTRVVPGDPDNSYLIMKLEGTHIEKGGIGARMPFGAPPLAPEKIAKLRQWIKEGAKG
jgi:hypothetical protein